MKKHLHNANGRSKHTRDGHGCRASRRTRDRSQYAIRSANVELFAGIDIRLSKRGYRGCVKLRVRHVADTREACPTIFDPDTLRRSDVDGSAQWAYAVGENVVIGFGNGLMGVIHPKLFPAS